MSNQNQNEINLKVHAMMDLTRQALKNLTEMYDNLVFKSNLLNDQLDDANKKIKELEVKTGQIRCHTDVLDKCFDSLNNRLGVLEEEE